MHLGIDCKFYIAEVCLRVRPIWPYHLLPLVFFLQTILLETLENGLMVKNVAAPIKNESCIET